MVAPINALLQPELMELAAPVPYTMIPTNGVMEVIEWMGRDDGAWEPDRGSMRRGSRSCVLVKESDYSEGETPSPRLVGIVTEWDLVCLSASGQNPQELAIADIMTSPVVTLNAADFIDGWVPLVWFERHQIHHLPLVTDQGNVVGLLTSDSLSNGLRSLDLLQDLQVADVMSQTIVQAPPTATLSELSQLMVEHQVNAVVIVSEGNSSAGAISAGWVSLQDTHQPLDPIGVVTTREIVQALALNLDLSTTACQPCMALILSVGAGTVLETAQALMQEQPGRPLLVTQADGSLCGCVTQTDLLNLLHPRMLQRILQERTHRLEEQLARNQLLTEIASHIHASLDLQEVLEAAVTGVRSLLQCDRTLIHQFQPNWSGVIVAESVAEGWSTALGNHVEDNCFQAQEAIYQEGRMIAIDNVQTAGYTDCHLELLDQYQVKANLVVPILVSGKLWGLLIGHQCGEVRTWQESDLTLLNEIAVQLAIAVQQATTRQHLQAEESNPQRQSLSARLNLAVKSAGIGIWEWDLVNQVKIWDDRMYELYGIRPDQRADFYQVWVNALHPEDRLLTETALQQALRGEKEYDLEFRVIRPDGSTRFLKAFGLVQRDGQGNPQRMIGINMDITEQKQTELTLRASEERWQLALRGSNDGIWDWDVTNDRVFCSSRWKAMRGMTEEEGSDCLQEWADSIHPDDYEQVMAAVDAHFAGRTEFFEMEYRVRRKDGSYLWIFDRGQALRDSSGRVIRMSGSETDITQRKVAETERERLLNALQASEERYRKIVETQTEFILRSSPDSTITFANTALCQALGRSLDQILGRAWSEFVPDTEMATLYQKIAALTPEQPTFENINPDYRAMGQLGWTQWVNLGVFDEQGELIEIQSVGRDVTQLHQIEDALRQSEALFRNAFNNTVVGMSLVSPEGRFLKVNTALCEFLHYSETELLNLTFQEITYPEDLDTDLGYVHQALSGDINSYHIEKRFFTKHGQVVWGLLNVSLVRDGRDQPLYFVSQTQNINDRKQAEDQLRDLSQRLNLALQSAEIGIWEWDVPNDRLLWDDRMCALYGIRREDFHGHYEDWARRVHPDDIAAETENEGRALRGEQKGDTEFRVLRPDGTVRYIMASSLVQRNQAGEPQHVIGLNIDITHRKLALRENQQLKERLQFLLSSSPAVIYTCKPEGDFGTIFIGDNIFDLTGYTAAEFTAESNFWVDHVHPDDVSNVFEALPSLFERGSLVHEYRFRHKDGSYVWVRDELRLVRDEQERPIEIVGYFADISDRKNAEAALQRSEERLRLSMEGAQMGAWDVDLITGKAIWSERHYTLLGYDPVEIGEASEAIWSDRLHPDDRDRVLQEWQQSRREHRLYQAEYRVIRADTGQITWLAAVGNFTYDRQDRAIRSIGVMFDINDRKQAEIALQASEAQLERSNAELMRATRLKDEFLANMSHELRTPLNAILGMSETLLENILGEINQHQRKAIATIESSGQHLLELINDILDLSKMSAGQLELSIATASIPHLCSSSLMFVKQQALKKQIQLHVSIAPGLDMIEVDERRIRQSLVNLLTNAVKFTPVGGHVTLEVKLQTLRHGVQDSGSVDPPESMPGVHPAAFNPSANPYVLFSVIDTGIGIALEAQSRLFQPFVQVDSSLNRQYEGTGLGLALVKQIVELHNGFVSLTSELGQGSCFTIHLPYFTLPKETSSLLPSQPQPVPNTSINTAEAVNHRHSLILLAEDNQANVESISSYLETYGYRLIVASNGQEAIDLTQAQRPELILMDIQMPGMDGLEAIQVIRRNPQIAQIPIIAITALAMTGDRERCLAAGADLYMTKPLKLKQLILTIQELLEQS